MGLCPGARSRPLPSAVREIASRTHPGWAGPDRQFCPLRRPGRIPAACGHCCGGMTGGPVTGSPVLQVLRRGDEFRGTAWGPSCSSDQQFGSLGALCMTRAMCESRAWSRPGRLIHCQDSCQMLAMSHWVVCGNPSTEMQLWFCCCVERQQGWGGKPRCAQACVDEAAGWAPVQHPDPLSPVALGPGAAPGAPGRSAGCICVSGHPELLVKMGTSHNTPCFRYQEGLVRSAARCLYVLPLSTGTPGPTP